VNERSGVRARSTVEAAPRWALGALSAALFALAWAVPGAATRKPAVALGHRPGRRVPGNATGLNP
jgi:hypothetical protein